MRGEKPVIGALNKVLLNELTAINQHFLHARMQRNWGFEALGKHAYKASIDDMKHADRIIERILFLEGLPNLQALGKLLIGETPQEVLRCDLKMAQQSAPVLREAIAACEQAGDFVSRELLVDVLETLEHQADWLETQLSMIERLGEPAYLQATLCD